jgi:RHS repeat-associated protein
VTRLLPTGNRYKRTYGYTVTGNVDSVAVTQSSANAHWYTRRYFYSTTLDSMQLNTETIVFGRTTEFLRNLTTYPSGVVQVDSVDDSHRLSWEEFQAPFPGGIFSQLSRYYAYDSTNRVVEVDFNRSPTQTVQAEWYAYDGLGELSARYLGFFPGGTCNAKHPTNGFQCVGGVTDTSFHASYDAAQNLDSLETSVLDSNVMAIATYLVGNRQASLDSLAYMNDADGNRTSMTVQGIDTVKYTWGADNRLLQVRQGTTTIGYAYSALGLLAERTVNGTPDRYFLWDRGVLLGEVAAGTKDSVIAEYAYLPSATQPIAAITGPVGATVPHFLVTDAKANVIGKFTDTTFEQRLDYDPWGKLTAATTASDTLHIRWKGYLYQGDVQPLYYAQARWYDPISRRFLSEDPAGLAGGTGNLYAFGGGDAVNGQDPTGTDICDVTMPGDCFSVGGPSDSNSVYPPLPDSLPQTPSNSIAATDSIGCNFVLPNGQTLGQVVNQYQAQLQSIVDQQAGLTAGGGDVNPFSVTVAFSAIAAPYGPIDFKNTFKGQANPSTLGHAGNFAYYAIGSGFLPTFELDAGAGGYGLATATLGRRRFSDLRGPMFSDVSAARERSAGLAAGGCPQ